MQSAERFFARSIDKDHPTAALPITIDEFYNGTDDEILAAVMHRAAEILESEKSGMQLAGEATDLIQDVLGALSLIPVVGDVAAGLDAGIDFARGNPGAALVSVASMFPILGEQAAILKVTERVASRAARVARAGRIVEFGGALVRYVRSVRLGLPVGFDAAKGFESFRAF